ncbi:MAG: hypothetical protein GX548_07835 [Lentisphaerae bacterium]|nr:hypothetical protein [Lentisphaerota bacterium]
MFDAKKAEKMYVKAESRSGKRFEWPSLAILVMACRFLSGVALAYDPVSPPDWAGEPGRVRHLYLFPNDTLTPAPDESDNPFGAPDARVTLGPYAAGWQNPDPSRDVPQSAGEAGSGAWDLGKGSAGNMRVVLPIGNASTNAGFCAYQVQLKVNVVYYDRMVVTPLLGAEGFAAANESVMNTAAFPDTQMGSWSNCTWSGTLVNVTDDRVTLVVSADPVWGSTIDAIEIYALAEPVSEVLYTAMGVPIAWYQSLGFAPVGGDDWNGLDDDDADGDGVPNSDEYVAGTDPTDPESFLRIVNIRVVDGHVPHLEWIGGTLGPSTPYLVDSTTSLRKPDWQVVGSRDRVAGTNDWTGAGLEVEGQRFFRIRATRGVWP